jgi:hypothetical protein
MMPRLCIIATVGLNPLPVLVAIRRLLLLFPEAQLTFVVSTDHRDQEVVAIQEALRGHLERVLVADIIQLNNPKDPDEIRRKVSEYARGHNFSHIHFHYTGGTKVMVLHVMRALDGLQARTPITTSYFGAEEHALIGNLPETGTSEGVMGASDERLELQLTVDDLAQLHGYTTTFTVNSQSCTYTAGPGPRRGGRVPHIPNPRTPPDESWSSVTDSYSRIQMSEWSKLAFVLDQFRDTWFPEKGRRFWPRLPDTSRRPQNDIRWPFSALPQSKIPIELNQLLGREAWSEGVFRPDALDGCELERIGRWLRGDWLEDYVFMAFTRALSNRALSDISVGVRFTQLRFLDAEKTRQAPVRKDFEIDVAVVLGYQLVAISCYAGPKEATAKQKGFEAIHRARQLGGNEAVAILVCLADDAAAEAVEQELDAQARTFGVPIRVWSRIQVQNLDRTVVGLLDELRFF